VWPEDLRDEIAPKNIIMIGPTGIGKTEIARRLSKLAQSPFLKIEASKFTEVGYGGPRCGIHGQGSHGDRQSIWSGTEETEKGSSEGQRNWPKKRILDLLLPPVRRKRLLERRRRKTGFLKLLLFPTAAARSQVKISPTREKLRQRLRAGSWTTAWWR